jgi:hypothetical protein
MGFDYDKIKKDGEDGNQWASYSDLFMVLSFVFLLLYVIASLRSGTFSVQKSVQFKMLKEEAEDLKEQIKVYNTLKEDYVKKDASQKEQKVYQRLMGKLDLLQEDRKEEATELRRRAVANEQKEDALNEYQRIIRNIINTNMLAKSRIKKRDTTIKKNEKTIVEKKKEIKQNLRKIFSQNQEIEQQSQTISKKQKIIEIKKAMLVKKQTEIKVLEKDIVVKKKIIVKNKRQMTSIDNELKRKIKTLKKTQRAGKLSKTKLKKDIAWLKLISKRKIKKLKTTNSSVSKELKSVSTNLASVNRTVKKQDREKQKLDNELKAAAKRLRRTQSFYKKEVKSLNQSNKAKLRAERIAFEKKIEKEKLTVSQKEAKMRKFKALMARKESTLKDQIQEMEQQSEQTEKEFLAQKKLAASQIANVKSNLRSAEKSIKQAENERRKVESQLNATNIELKRNQTAYKKRINKLKSKHNTKAKTEQRAFNQKLNKMKLSANERSKRMKVFKNQMRGKQASLIKKLKTLANKNSESQAALKSAKGKADRRLASIEKLKQEQTTLKGQSKKMSKSLKAYRAREAAKKQLSKQIVDELAKAGIKSGIDGETGEVTLSFGKEFFSSGKAILKPGMKKVLQKFIPRYAKSLYKNKSIANRIKNVEIVGHASPTYNGKYVNPNSLRPEDQKATRYNLDLSINRAKAIFNHIFDTGKMTYKHQRRLRSQVKVTGRGFFSGKQRMPSSEMSQRKFCKKFNCKKAQTVIIKFNLKE